MNNKIILATSGLSDTEKLFRCIKDMIRDTQSMVIEANISDKSQLPGLLPDTRSMQEIRDRVYSNVTNFENTCIKYHIKHAVRSQFDNYFFEDLIVDSRFADLIVCSSGLLSDGNKSYKVNNRIQSESRRLECPLLVVPENSEDLMLTDLFLFDGSLGSIKAIKTFTYLFPERCKREVLLINRAHNDEVQKMSVWLAAHYKRFALVNELPAHNQYNLICNAFKGSMLSECYRVPVFICHS